MKKLIITTLAICLVFFGFSFLILFDAKLEHVFKWWSSYTRHSQTLPYSPYKIRREDSAFLRTEEANNVQFIDKHLFWKGMGAVALPEITKSGMLVKLKMKSEGSRYSNDVEAIVTGSMGNSFKLGKVRVKEGKILGVNIIKPSKWHSEPKVFWGDEELPYSGTIEKLFPDGQLMFQKQFLSGVMHGKWDQFTISGIPVFSKDYLKGKKHGTHIFWFDEPFDPEGYELENTTSLWASINEEAEEKFSKGDNQNEYSNWVIANYKLRGGSFQVYRLEHWENNQKHGLFEGFDRFGNKTFKDDYDKGLRVKHRIFDKTKTKTFDRKVK
jgi:antitoxin component YwqK of YwqJK toxin-antitoxin module